MLEWAAARTLIADINKTNQAGVLGLLFIPSRDIELVKALRNEIEQLVKLRTGQLSKNN
jgi:hypothetical protein